MKKLLFLVLFSFGLFAQERSKVEQLNDLNKQLWLPFIEGVNTAKADLYVGVHAKDFYWVSAGSNGRIMDLPEYADDSVMVMKQRKEQGTRSEMEVRFLERNVDGDFASERCIVKFTMHERGKEPQVSYGVSQYFSRKENGVWRMWMQFKPADKGSAEMFASAAPLEDTARFAAKPQR